MKRKRRNPKKDKMRKLVKGLADIMTTPPDPNFKPKKKKFLDVHCEFFQKLNRKKKWSREDFLKFHDHAGRCEVCKERRREITDAKSGTVSLADELGIE